MPISRTISKYLTAILLALAAAFPSGGAEERRGYAEPDFVKPLFVREALLLETQEVASAVTALTAIATNFPLTALVNHRLRAKALAIALRLDGTHPGAVTANTALRSGQYPEAIADFPTLEEVARQLWTTASFLNSPEKGKDERVLQYCLVDIARELDPDNLADSNLYPTRLPSGVFPGWGSILRKSDRPAFEFSPEGGEPGAGSETEENPDPGPGSDPPPANPTSSAQGSVNTVVVDGDRHAIATITGDLKAGGGKHPLAIIFADVEGDSDQPLNLYREALVSALTELHGSWPQGGGVLVLTVMSPDQDDQALLLPSAILADSLIRQNELSARVAALGFVAPEGSLIPVDNLFQRLQALKQSDAEIIIVPKENLPDLQDLLLQGELASIFRHQILIASTLKEAVGMAGAAGGDEELQKSLTEFETIQDVVNDGNLAEMVKYSAVTDKLKKIATLNPQHASAALLLEYGTGKLPEHMTRGGSLAALDRATSAVVRAMRDQGGADRATAAAAYQTITGLQPVLDPDTGALATMMNDLLKDVATYAEYDSKSSDPATELKAQILSDWETVRTEFGRLKNRDDE